MGQGILESRAGLLERIAIEVGTPTYVYFADTVRSQVAKLRAALQQVPHRIHYSVKANSNLAVLRLMRSLDVSADIVSGGELSRATAAGFRPEEIVFSGVGKTPEELDRAVTAGVGLINLESEGEFESIAEIAARCGRTAALGIRINPDVTTATHPYTQTGAEGMKFGIPLDRVPKLAHRIRESQWVELTSIGMHIGSQIAKATSYSEGAAKLETLVRRLQADGCDTLTTVDIGGGMAIPHGNQPGLDLGEFAEAVCPMVSSGNLTMLVEPGRFLIGSAGVLVTRVLYCKNSGGRRFAVVDAGMNDFARPSYYGAEHEISLISALRDEGMADSFDVVGPICETGDYLGLKRKLPECGPGALLAVHDAGAYGFSMSSTYNSRPRPAEVLVDGERAGVIRRRETIADLWRGEPMEPEWLDSEVIPDGG